MDTIESRAVSPVVGVILVVAITVALSGVVGVFVFDLGQSSTDSTNSNLGTRTTYNDGGTATVQVVTGEADELRVLVNGTKQDSIQNPAPGDSVTVAASPNSKITVVESTNGESSIVSASSSTGSGGYTSNSAPSPVATADSTLVNEGNTVNFDGTGSSDEDGSIDTYEWDVDGDGTYDVTGETPSHTYTNAGTYQVVLRVIDDGGTSATDSITITVEETAPTAGLIAHYKLDSGATDASGNGNDGSVQGATQYDDSTRGPVYEFDGSNDYIDIPDIFANDGEAETLSAWVYADRLDYSYPNTGGGIIGKNGLYGGSIEAANNNWRLGTLQNDGTAYVSGTSGTLSTWTHLVLVFDPANGEVIAYKDGVEFARLTGWDGTYKDSGLSGYTAIGAAQAPEDMSEGFFDGRIDDVRVYDRPLNNTEVGDLYNATK